MNNLFNIPLYKQLENIIIKKVRDQKLLPGQKLPGERILAKKYGLNRITVSKAINELVNKGILIKKPSSGTFVKQVNDVQQLSFSLDFENNGISHILKQQGMLVQNSILGKEIINDSRYLQKKLDLNGRNTIFGIRRLRLIKGVPFAVENNYVPVELFKDIKKVDFRYIGLYDYFSAKGIIIHNIYKRVQLITVPTAEAKRLKIDKNTLVFKIQYSSIDKNRRLVEYTESYIRPDEVKLQFTVDFE